MLYWKTMGAVRTFVFGLLLLLAPLALASDIFDSVYVLGASTTFSAEIKPVCTAFAIESADDATLFLTSAHCYRPAMRFYVARDLDADATPATLERISAGRSDLALFKAAVKVPALPLGADPTIGAEVWSVSFPRGISKVLLSGNIAGRLLGTHLWLLQSPAASNGSSGAPILSDGKVVGVLIGHFSEVPGLLVIEPISAYRATEWRK